MMRTLLAKSLGGIEALEFETIKKPVPGDGEILIKVTACGLNYFDTLITKGKYQFKPELPFAPGGEVAGVIEDISANGSSFKVGDRVAAYTGFGGLSEYVSVPENWVFKIPDNVSDQVAAGVSITYGTAMHGLIDRGEIKKGETLVVLGASGGAGMAAVELGALLGAKVIGVASGEDKLNAVKLAGALHMIDYKNQSIKKEIKSLTDQEGADIIYDCVGGDFSEAALRATAWLGRFLVIGFASGDIPAIPLNLTLVKGLDIRGVFWSEFASRNPGRHAEHMSQILNWCSSGKINPLIGDQFTFTQSKLALEKLKARQAKGKIIINF